MNEMLKYIFNTMKVSEAALVQLKKTVRRQARSNRRLKFIAVVGVAYAILAEVTFREQHKEIQRLSSEVEELKRKGE